ncbi:MAG: hypothetical protein K6G25_03435 [Bacteroidales bacterium]|nr:hypothetical protein [Bacteroidales bacterium]
MKPRLLVILFALLATACTKHNDQAEIDLNVNYEINGKPLITDTLCYTNEAGNLFLITEIQWFLSDIELKNEDGDWTLLQQRWLSDTLDASRIFYIDTDIPETQNLRSCPVKAGHYTAIRFTFGLDDYDNYTGLFNDPPESEMFWPDVLGGGYHYMKLNGKFAGSPGRLQPVAIHLGIGQNEDGTEFFQNYFIVELPLDFDVKANADNRLDLTMVIDNWFRNPHVIDFNELGSSIMQNQNAQRLFNGNGKDVFKIGKPDDNNIKMKREAKLVEKFNEVMHYATPKPHFWTWENVRQTFEQIKESDKNRS